jgi:WD40 repeat protein
VETRAAGEQPSAFALHADAGLVATAYADGRVVIDSMAAGGGQRGAWQASARGINAAVFSEDGAHLCVAGTDRVVRVYGVATGELLHELVGHERDVFALSFDPRERAVWSLAVDQTLRRWSLESGESSVEARIQDFPRVLRHRGDGTIALVETDRAWVQERARGALRSVAYPRNSFAHAVVLGDAVVTIEGTGEVRRWSTRFRPSIEPIRAHRNWVFGADLSAAHGLLVTSSGDETVRFSDASGLGELGRFELPRRVRARCVRFSPDESIVAVGGSDGIVRIFDASTRTLVGTLTGPGGEIYALAFSPDGSTLAAGASSRAIRCWAVGDRALLGSEGAGDLRSWDLTGLESIPRGLVFSRDGGRLFGSGAANGILVIDPSRHAIESIIPTSAEPWSVAISPDGRRLASGLFDASVICIDLETRAISVGTTRHRLVVAGLDFSSDGRLIVSGGDDGAVRIWDSTGAHLRAVRLIDAGSGPVPLVRFAPGGSRVFAGTSVGVLLRWDLETHVPAIARNVGDAAATYATDESGLDPSRGLEWSRGR